MSLRTSLLRTALIVRSLAAPTTISGGTGLDVWINSLTVVTRTWWSGRVGDGDYEDAGLTLSPNPDVREVSSREIASSGGLYKPKDLRVGHITPYHAGPPAGGYTPEQLAPTFAAVRPRGEPVREVFYRVEGPLAGEYERVEGRFGEPFEYVLVLRRLNRSASRP
ncbi:hypothetical protein [Sorangium sp. So ce233]|uniref:hypothetical protein n=1 Tax=Sorangium sp. So ce233 TaxID=3133290 RepID=UPI003F5FF9F3